MSEYSAHRGGEGDESPHSLPENLSALVGSIQGPTDLGPRQDLLAVTVRKAYASALGWQTEDRRDLLK